MLANISPIICYKVANNRVVLKDSKFQTIKKLHKSPPRNQRKNQIIAMKAAMPWKIKINIVIEKIWICVRIKDIKIGWIKTVLQVVVNMLKEKIINRHNLLNLPRNQHNLLNRQRNPLNLLNRHRNQHKNQIIAVKAAMPWKIKINIVIEKIWICVRIKDIKSGWIKTVLKVVAKMLKETIINRHNLPNLQKNPLRNPHRNHRKYLPNHLRTMINVIH